MSYSNHTLSRSNKRKFATTNPVGVDSLTYAGELADFYVTPALKAADTLANNYVTQLDGLSNKAVVTGATVADDVIQAANCDFTDGDSVTVDERVLTLSDLMVNEELCRGTILPAWWSIKGSRNSDWATPEFRNFVLATVAAKVADGVETSIWNSSAAMTTGFLSNDGVFNRAGLGAAILVPGASATDYIAAGKATGVAIAAITANNCIAGFGSVHSKAAETAPGILSKADLAFYVGPKTFALYQQALATAGGAGYVQQVTNQNLGELNYLGVPVRRCPGIPGDAIVLTYASNLFVGSNLRTDYTQVQYIPAYQYDGSDNVKVTMRFGLGCQVGTPDDVIVGSTTAILPA